MLFKSFIFLLILSVMSFFLLVLSIFPYFFNFFFKIPDYKFNFMEFGMSHSYSTLIFMFMVLVVTSMVLLYGEMYMEHYNNKKFFFLTISFLGSMILLSLSESFLLFMIGWDGLGLSSLFLIMFYPGKISLFNSFMTFFYNRLGDCLLILVLCYSSLSSDLLMKFFSPMEFFTVLTILVMCSFTKSAQFPLSSWLPAAMSAPTPISAMVHSSTLVTAGVLLLYKFFYFLSVLMILKMLFFFSCLTFLIGGFLGFLELDLKKIVAFSTMSQISMILVFLSLTEMSLSILHMISHAMFKTLLFCSCGLNFLWIFSDQLSKVSNSDTKCKFFLLSLLVSIFCMSGLPFSSSFFTKDIFLEMIWIDKNLFILFCLILGSILTIFYSSKIFSLFYNSYVLTTHTNMKKKSSFMFFLVFCGFTLLSPYFCESFIYFSFIPIISNLDLVFILLIFMLSILVLFSNMWKNSYFPLSLMFSKFFMFSMLSKIFKLDYFSLHFSDQMVFKPNLVFSSFLNLYTSMKSFMFMFIFLISVFLVL